MRAYAIHRAESRAAATPSLIARLIHNWKARRRLAALADLEDETLEDIGFTRDEISWALSVPLTFNPAEELEESAFRRRLEEARRRYLPERYTDQSDLFDDGAAP